MMNWLTCRNIPTCEGINVWLGNNYLADDNDDIKVNEDDDELLLKEVSFERTESLPCDPELCRSMGRTICVDCTKCVHHCICDQPQQDNDGATCSTGSSISFEENFEDPRGGGRRCVVTFHNNNQEIKTPNANVAADNNVNNKSHHEKKTPNPNVAAADKNVNKSHHEKKTPNPNVVAADINVKKSYNTRNNNNVAHYGCDPAECPDHFICGDCSRCSRHCTCVMEDDHDERGDYYERSRSLTSPQVSSSTRIRNSIRRRWSQTNHRPLSAGKMRSTTSEYGHNRHHHVPRHSHRVERREERPSMVGNNRRRR